MNRLWTMLAIVLIFGFTVLGWIGSRIYQHMPPIPERIVTTDGRVVVPDGAIRRGQAVWQTLGGMEVGSIWGHGSYVAPDWTADWLHRECELILDDWARSEQGRAYAALRPEPQAALRERLRLTLRGNRYDAAEDVEWELAQWGEHGCRIDRFLVFGDARLVGRIRRAFNR